MVFKSKYIKIGESNSKAGEESVAIGKAKE